VAAPEQTLEALVRDDLRGPVSELVRQVGVELVPYHPAPTSIDNAWGRRSLFASSGEGEER
jgi:hypothetical protein